MKKLIITLFALIFLSTIVLGWTQTTHCWRPDASRAVNVSTEFSDTFGVAQGYDYIIPPGTTLTVSGIGEYTLACDDGASGSTRNYVDLYDVNLSQKVASNNPPNGPPVPSSAVGCYTSEGSLCYRSGREYFPRRGTCGKNGLSIGSGVTENFSYTFPANALGPKTVMVRLSTITKHDSVQEYRGLRTLNLFIGRPILLTFSPEKRKIISTFDETGQQQIEFFFSVMNPSPLLVKLEDYSINCPAGTTCVLETRADGNKRYKDYIIRGGQEMIIPVVVTIDKSRAPISIVVSMDFNYNGVDIGCSDTPGPCKVTTEPSRLDFGLMDQQNFQVEIKTNTDLSNCVGEDGMTGQTGENFAPRVNLSFGNETSPLISLNECDAYLQDGNENKNWVYCTQEEFLTELAAKIGELGHIREQIFLKESLNLPLEVQELRRREAKLLDFNTHLRTQEFNPTDVNNSIEETKGYINRFVSSSGLEIFGSAQQQTSKFEKLIKSIKFNVTTQGSVLDTKDILAGLYQVKIDLNELNESLQSNYLFNTSGELNPALDIKVNLEKIQDPSFDWFFYHSKSNNLSEDFNLTYIPDTQNTYITNVSKRGIVIDYTKTNNGEEDTSFFRTYAVPLIARLDSDTLGQTNGRLRITNAEIASQFNPEDGVFSYWTGFASSIEDGCVSTITNEETTLPYRIPDQVKTNQGEIEFNSLDYPMLNAKPNTKMYLQTVLYIPKGKYIDILSPMKLYTNTTTCTNPTDTNCLITITENASTGKIYDLNSTFNAIREQKVCVSKKISATGEVWTLFWNQNEMLKQIQTRKTDIINTNNKDAKICEIRESLGG